MRADGVSIIVGMSEEKKPRGGFRDLDLGRLVRSDPKRAVQVITDAINKHAKNPGIIKINAAKELDVSRESLDRFIRDLKRAGYEFPRHDNRKTRPAVSE